MRKIREGSQSDIVDYYFAVFPSVLSLRQPFGQPLLLYFQKDLQIVSRYDSQSARLIRRDRIDFGCPPLPQIFRVKSEKVMEYSWSLYFRRSQNQGQSEQYLASEKIHLKATWESFKVDKQFVRTLSVEFQTQKMKLDYVFVISLSERAILENIQTFEKKQTSAKTIYSEFTPSIAVSRVKTSEKASSLQDKNMLESKIGQDRSDFQDETIRSDTNVQPTLYGGESVCSRYPEGTSIILQVHEYPVKSRKKNDEQPDNTVPLDDSNFHMTNHPSASLHPQLELPSSKADISKEIQNKNYSSKDINQFNHSNSPSNKQQQRKVIVSQQHIRITASQFIDSEGRIIILPFYSQFKYILIIILIFLSFMILMKMGPSFNNLPIIEIQPPVPKRQKALADKKSKKTSKKKL